MRIKGRREADCPIDRSIPIKIRACSSTRYSLSSYRICTDTFKRGLNLYIFRLMHCWIQIIFYYSDMDSVECNKIHSISSDEFVWTKFQHRRWRFNFSDRLGVFKNKSHRSCYLSAFEWTARFSTDKPFRTVVSR